YGKAFLQAGDGEWGRKMQDDVTDGVKALVDDGFADPSRICIVGASYGGYSALAGGAFTPDLYACIVAIAPVSDLAQMIASVGNSKGHKAWSVFYWKRVIGDPSTESDRINSVSPARQASAFKAPVLLVHGKDDTVVSIQQSETMDAALRSAGKSVEFVRLAGEDHWLSDGPTRIATLQAVSDFVERHIGEP
ncbi:MAG: prolyl oligopeptidase family serine peptidase, partial [Alphaproteobacteria bacterium]|nr:prolyl oligopeptidase family serine peptidase [Alphaproteobacteria bacterium]